MTKKLDTFNKIYKKYHKKILRFIVRMIKDFDSAEDILQDVFVIYHSNMDKVIDNEEKYLFTIVRNRIMFYFEKQNYGEKLTQKVQENNQLQEQALKEKEQRFLEAVHIAEKFADNEDEYSKEVFLLKEFHGLTYNDISELTGLSKRKIEFRLGKTWTKINEKMGKDNPKTVEELLA